jgi:hypothetical protein
LNLLQRNILAFRGTSQALKKVRQPPRLTLLAANFAFVQHAIIGTVIGSAGMNAFAYHHGLDDLGGDHSWHRHRGDRRLDAGSRDVLCK